MDEDLICPYCGSDDIEKGYVRMRPAFFCGEFWRFICYKPEVEYETWEDYGLYNIENYDEPYDFEYKEYEDRWGEYR